jgi:hypothetical protein
MEVLDERGGVVSIAQRDRCQLEARDPAFGPIEKALDERGRERYTDRSEIGRGLLSVAAQVVDSEFDQPAVRPKPRQRQRRVSAGQHDEVDEGWSVLDQEPDEAMDRLCADELVIVDHQHARLVALAQRFDQRGADKLRAGGGSGTEEVRCRIGGRRSHRPQGSGEIAAETGEIIVGGIEREPGVADPARLQPADDGDRLAVARGRRQQRQAGAVLES